MSLEKASIQWSFKQIRGMIASGKISFDNIVQRSYVWERSRKTKFIESCIIGYPFPMVFAKRAVDEESTGRGGKSYYIMDGGNRLRTIKEFLSDEFALTDIPPVTYWDEAMDCHLEEDISGKVFSELPDVIKDELNATTITVTYFDNLTEDEERELFIRLNSGKPLSQKSKLLASCKDIRGMMDIGSHPLFQKMLSAKRLANKDHVTIVVKSWCMLNTPLEELSFNSKEFNPIVEQTTIDEAGKVELHRVFDTLVSAHDYLAESGDPKWAKIAKKVYTETHMVSLVPFVQEALSRGIASDLLGEWIADFYGTTDTASVSPVYNESCGGGSARHGAILGRHEALKESFDAFFKEDEVVEAI